MGRLEVQNLAHAHAVEFLDESADFTAADATGRHKLLRNARAVVMECMLALQPETSETKDITTVPINFGIDFERRQIFSGTTEDGGLLISMIFAIATAKKMGATNFEIDLKEEISKGPRQRQMPHPFLSAFQAGYDDWQSAGASTHRITIYAVQTK